MAIAQENIERIQRMEGYLNDYAKTLEETKKSSGTAKRASRKAISNCAIIIVVRPILMTWTYPIKLTFQQIFLVVSCPKMLFMIC